MDASTGVSLWAASYNGTGDSRDQVTAASVSPDGSKVFVTGQSNAPTIYREDDAFDYATIAYDARTGTELWVKRYGAANDNRDDGARDVGVSPDGSAVFVTGTSTGASTNFDYATIAYDASTGKRLWLRRYNGAVDRFNGDGDHAAALGVSPDGSGVFVTGTSDRSGATDYATVAYDALTGATLWVKRSRSGFDHAGDLGVSPDGSRVFVTGSGRTGQTGADYDYATVAYDASSGKRLWASHYERPGTDYDAADSLEVSPDGSQVFVAGSSPMFTGNDDYATVAYDASSGATRWVRRYNGTGDHYDNARALGVSRDGTQVFVTGVSAGSASIVDYYAEDYATVAYDALTGARLWTRRYTGPVNGSDGAHALAVSVDGSALFVTGRSQGQTDSDLATIAYRIE
jgi:hypothetical protein